MDNLKTFKITTSTPDKDCTSELRGTKAVIVKIPQLNYTEEVTTWSALTRAVISKLNPYFNQLIRALGEDEFRSSYLPILEAKLKYAGMRFNVNCPKGIFKDDEIDEHINSKVYIKNKNHNITLCEFDGHTYNVCAVYTCEVIYVLSALITYVSRHCVEFAQEPLTIEITYIDRGDIEDEDGFENVTSDVADSEFSPKYDELERNCIALALKFKELITEVYDMTSRFGLDRAEDIIKSIYSEDLPKELKGIDKNN